MSPRGSDGARGALRTFWTGVGMWAAVFVPASLFGFDPARVPVRLVSWLLGAGGVLVVWGVVRFFVLTRGDAAARRRGMWMIATVAGVVAASAATVMGLYVVLWDEAQGGCHRALRAGSAAEQRALLEEAAAARARIGFFNERVYVCEDVESAIEALARGECPRLVPGDAECRCGEQRHPADWTGAAGRARCDHYPSGDFQEVPMLSPRGPHD